MQTTHLLVLQFLMSLAAYAAIGGWFVYPWLRSTAWYGPAFVVPGMLVAHALIFVFLIRAERPSA